MEDNDKLEPDLKPKDGSGLESTLKSFRFGSQARNLILKTSQTTSDAADTPPHDDAVEDYIDNTDIHHSKPLVTTIKTTKQSAPANPPPPKTSRPKPPPPELIAIKRAPEYLSVCPPGKIPLAPFISKAKFPRKFRNTLLRKLFGEHLALLAAENNWLAPQKAVKRDDLMEVAIRLALEQEIEVYNKCKSGGVYQHFAAKCSALQYGPTTTNDSEDSEDSEDAEPVLYDTRDKKRPRILEVVEEIDIFSDEERDLEKEKQREEDSTTLAKKKEKSKTISAWHQVKKATARWVSDKVDVALANNDDGSVSELILETVKNDVTLQILGRHVGETTTAFLEDYDEDEEEGIKKMIEEAITSQF